MGVILNIKEAARKRGVTLSSIAKRLKMARSNMSAISSGARGISLAKLSAISDILGCGIDELVAPKERPIFKNRHLDDRLYSVEEKNYDGLDKSWVSRTMFAHVMHYKRIHKVKP